MRKLLTLLILTCPSAALTSSFTEINLSSPEATYQTFYTSMAAYSKAIKEERDDLAEAKLEDALATFEADPNSPSYTKSSLEQSAIHLKETLDRLLQSPEAPEITGNRIAGTNIRFVSVGKETYISKFSLDRAGKDYTAVKTLPYTHKNNPGARLKVSWLNKLIPNTNADRHFGLTKQQWALAGLSLIAAFFIYYFLILLLAAFDKTLFTQGNFNQSVYKALVRPFALISTALFLKAAGQSIQLMNTAKTLWMSAAGMLLSIGVFWILYGLMQPLERSLLKVTDKTESDLDDQLVPLLMKTAKIGIIILAVLTIIQELGINVFSLIAGLGVGGLAIALAAKDTAANFFGSLMILFDQPFKKGDWIKVDDMEGTVEEIGFRSTRVRTFYDSQIIIPNSTMASSEIDNLGRRKLRRTVETLGLTYSTTNKQLEAFVNGIKSILKEHPNTKDEKSYVSFKRFGDSALEVLLYFFLDVDGYESELISREEIYRSIKTLAEELKVEFAFPSQSIYIEKGGAPYENTL